MLAFTPILGHLGLSDQSMTIRITGPRRRAPWQGAARALIVAAIIFSICLILLGLIGGFLVDWLWFSAIGYFGVFWTTIVAEAEVFIAVFVATTIILWVNGSLAFRFAQSGGRSVAPSLSGNAQVLQQCPICWNSCAISCRGASPSPAALVFSLCLSPGER